MSREPRSPRVVCVALAALAAAGVVRPAAGQESGTRIGSRVSDRLDVRVQPEVGFRPPGALERSEGFRAGVTVSGVYDDNITLSANAPEKDLVTRVAPSVSYQKGDPDGGEGAYLRIAYRPEAVVYADHSGSNRIDHDVSWNTGWRGRKVSLAGGGRVRQLGDATADTGRPTDRLMVEQAVRAAWMPGERVAVEIAAGRETTDYQDRTLADSKGAFGEVALRYQYSPKTRVGVAYRAGTFDVDGAGEQKIQRGTVRMEWAPRDKVSFDLEAGAERRKYDNGSSVSPILEAKVAWRPREGTEWFLGGYRRTEASASLPGQNYDATGISGGVSQRLGEKWTGAVETGFERTKYEQVSGPGTADRSDDIFFIRPSLRYQWTENLGIEGFYRFERDRSNQAGFGYDNQSVGVSLDYQF